MSDLPPLGRPTRRGGAGRAAADREPDRAAAFLRESLRGAGLTVLFGLAIIAVAALIAIAATLALR